MNPRYSSLPPLAHKVNYEFKHQNGGDMETAAMLTVAESAETLATTPTKILMLLKNGDLKGEEIAGKWFIDADSLACCKSHGIDMKAVKGCVSYCSSGGCGCK
jgi:hypothetical protein